MKDLLHPSLLQINYLMTLEKIEKKRGCVGSARGERPSQL